MDTPSLQDPSKIDRDKSSDTQLLIVMDDTARWLGSMLFQSTFKIGTATVWSANIRIRQLSLENSNSPSAKTAMDSNRVTIDGASLLLRESRPDYKSRYFN